METIMTKKTLPRYWQSSGKICGAILAAVIALIAPGTTHAQATWAHQNGSLAPSGAVAIRSLSGGAYVGTQNPAGASAKGNQAAATQPATVLIQATASAYSETYPVLVNAATAPACTTGYNSVFSASGTGPISPPILNAGGSRYTLGSYTHPSNGWVFNTVFIDQLPLNNYINNFALNIPTAGGYVGNTNQIWSARICSK